MIILLTIKNITKIVAVQTALEIFKNNSPVRSTLAQVNADYVMGSPVAGGTIQAFMGNRKVTVSY